MSDIKEKPKGGKPKARDSAALLPQQAGRLLKEKYLRQLDQRQPGEDSDSEYATSQVEGGTRRAVDELTATATRRPIKERPASKTCSAEARAPKTADHATRQSPKCAPTTARSTKPGQPPAHTTLNNRRRSDPVLHAPPVGTPPQSAQPIPHMPNTPPVETSAGGVATPKHRTLLVKERIRTAATVKSRQSVRGVTKPSKRIPKPRPAMPSAPVRQAARKARQTAQHQVTRRMTTQAAKAAKTAALSIKRITVAVVKAVAAAIGALAGLVGGGVLLVVLLVVIVIAAVANSPFGLFFAAEKNASDTVSVAEAVSQVNMAYNARLEELQAGDYDSIEMHGQAPDWSDVLAVFAVKLSGADAEGLDVATLDADRVDKLAAVFWNMTAITTAVETIDHPENEDTPDWRSYILHITITAKSGNEMRTVYHFNAYQNSALDELLSDRAALSALAGSLTITNADLADILKNLPAGLPPERREAVRTALTLVGKVNYFWGGKSHVIGWDSRWGTLQKVWAEGNSTTGTYRPFGLDCSGYVDWIFNNSMDYIIGHGGGVIMQHTYCTAITPAEAQPGDLTFFPDDSHVGIVVGRTASGRILVAHCSSGQNNVVVTDCAATGFTAIGRPDIFH